MLMSLPHVFNTSLETVPGRRPYLFPEAELVDHWRGKIGTEGFKVGICWQGNPETFSTAAARSRCSTMRRSPRFPASG